MQAFEAAARHGGLRQAAAELGVTESAVSHQVRQLEAALGQPLFLREKQRLKLMAEARPFLAALSESFDRMALASDELKGRTAGGVLTLSVSGNFAARWLAPRLGSFAAAHPEIDLRVTVAAHRVDFAREGIDLAIRHGDGQWPDLFVERLAKEELFPVASPGYLTMPKLDTLRAGQLIRSLGRDDWPLWLAAAGRPQLKAEGPAFDQDFMAIDAAIAGQGLAMARSLLVARDLLARRLVRPFPLRLPAPFAYWIAAPPAFARRPKVRAFRAWLTAEATAELAQISEATR